MLPFLTTKRSPSGNVAKAAPLAPQDALKGAQWSTTAGGTQCPSQRRDPLSLTAYKETMKTTELRSSRWCMAGEWRAVSASWTKRAWDWIQENIFHREDRQAIEPVVRMGGEVSSLWSFHILSGTWAGWEGAPGTGRGGGGQGCGCPQGPDTDPALSPRLDSRPFNLNYYMTLRPGEWQHKISFS